MNTHQLILINKFGAIKMTGLQCPEYQVKQFALEDIKAQESLDGDNNKVVSAFVILSDLSQVAIRQAKKEFTTI
jgi:hypothetical protein